MGVKFPFTVIRLDNLPKKNKRYFVYDEKQPGLRLYVTPLGTKTFQFQVRSKSHDRVVTRTLGKYPSLKINEAREQAAALLSEVNAGVNIELQKKEERRQRMLDPTVNDFADEYIEKYAKVNKRSWKADRRTLDVDILPEVGKLKMKDVTRRDLVAIIDNVSSRGSMIMANRVHALLSKLFAFALERDVVELSPVYGMKKRSAEKSRTRILTDDELRNLWCALGSSAAEMILKMIIATGQRPGEVRQIEWKEIQGDQWVVPAEKSKNGLVHVVPLPPIAMGIIEQMKGITSMGQYVFPGRRMSGELKGDRCLVDTVTIHLMAKIVEKLGWEEKARPHDLRRTVRSNLSKLGVGKDIAERILNHKEQGISATYDRHDYLREKTSALAKWNNHLEGIVHGNRAKVLKIRIK